MQCDVTSKSTKAALNMQRRGVRVLRKVCKRSEARCGVGPTRRQHMDTTAACVLHYRAAIAAIGLAATVFLAIAFRDETGEAA